MKYKFCVLEYGDSRQEFCLGQRNNDITIGSGPSDLIEINGTGISSMHARLAYTYSGVYLIVLGESGCLLGETGFLNAGSAILLKSPSTFTIGDIFFKYHEEAGPNNRKFTGEIMIVQDTLPKPDINLGTVANPITLGVDSPISLPIAPIFTAGSRLKRSSSASKDATINEKPQVSEDPTSTKQTPVAPTSWFRESLIRCAICLDVMRVATSALPCAHKFCNECIMRWKRRNKTCPRCRGSISSMVVDRDFDQICVEYATFNGITMPTPDEPSSHQPVPRKRGRMGAQFR